MDNLTPEERQVRLKKADSIRRMLAEQTSSGPRNSGRCQLTVVAATNYWEPIFKVLMHTSTSSQG